MLGKVAADPEPFLGELFKAWYALLTIRTIVVHAASTDDRMVKLVRHLPETERPLFADVADRFHQVASMADGQPEFLHGVIEFFQTRTSTHMTIAAESPNTTTVQQNDDMRRITARAAIVAVPTAVTGFFGQKHPLPRFRRGLRFHRFLGPDGRHRRRATPRSRRGGICRRPCTSARCRDRVGQGRGDTPAASHHPAGKARPLLRRQVSCR
jgi:hypothetical protein